MHSCKYFSGVILYVACVAGAKRGRGGGREKGKREGSACSKSLCFCSLRGRCKKGRGRGEGGGRKGKGKGGTQRQKFHTDDANQCLDNKCGSHEVPNIYLSNFTCVVFVCQLAPAKLKYFF